MDDESASVPESVRPALLWLREDLRFADQAAVRAAAATGRPVLACYVLDDEALGAASRWWLHQSLAEIAREIAARGGKLILRRGPARRVLPEIVAQTHAAEVHCSKGFEPQSRSAEIDVRARLAARGVALISHAGALLFDPEALRTQSGEPFRVFTPFWNACLRAAPAPAPTSVPKRLRFAVTRAATESLADWRLEPTAPDWAGGLRACWSPGERGARTRLDAFLERHIVGYHGARDRPDVPGTSRLSPHLHFGELSVRAAWFAAHGKGEDAGRAAFLRELGWREFAHHLLWHWPDFATESFRPEFRRFPWRADSVALEAWRRGQTGYPLVDAGMRELWGTGWMHNRVRMVAASFLVKHLLIPWQIGAAWFWDTLVDADLANNSVSWQWVAGSGADAAPYFRIFNPTLQGRKFDPAGDYVRRWVPELAGLPAPAIHEPAAAGASVLRTAGVALGTTYPLPIVDHREARGRALAAYAQLPRGGEARPKRAVLPATHGGARRRALKSAD